MKPYLAAGLIIATAGLVWLTGACRADDIETITVNTSVLESLDADAPFALAFSLTDGGVLDNNTVTLSNFSFGGGSASGTAITSDCVTAFFTCGGESGVISSSDPGGSVVELDDTDLYNGLVEDFNIPTTDALFSSFVTVDLAEDQVSAFSSDSGTPFAGMTATATPAVPEPDTFLLLGTGLVGLGLLRKRSGFSH